MGYAGPLLPAIYLQRDSLAGGDIAYRQSQAGMAARGADTLCVRDGRAGSVAHRHCLERVTGRG